MNEEKDGMPSGAHDAEPQGHLNRHSGISRRALLGGAGKLAYAAPVLTVFTLASGHVNAISLPPCGPNESPPGCTAVNGASPSPQRSRPPRRRRPPNG